MTNKEVLKPTRDLDKVGKETLVALLSSNSKDQAAEQLGITRKALYLREQKYDFTPFLAAVPQQALQALQMGSVKAADNFIRKIDDRDSGVSLAASREILDRVGLGTQISNNQTTNIQVVIPNELQNKYAIPSSTDTDNQ